MHVCARRVYYIQIYYNFFFLFLSPLPLLSRGIICYVVVVVAVVEGAGGSYGLKWRKRDATPIWNTRFLSVPQFTQTSVSFYLTGIFKSLEPTIVQPHPSFIIASRPALSLFLSIFLLRSSSSSFSVLTPRVSRPSVLMGGVSVYEVRARNK